MKYKIGDLVKCKDQNVPDGKGFIVEITSSDGLVEIGQRKWAHFNRKGETVGRNMGTCRWFSFSDISPISLTYQIY